MAPEDPQVEIEQSKENATKCLSHFGELLLTISDGIEPDINPLNKDKQSDAEAIAALGEILAKINTQDIETADFKTHVVESKRQAMYTEGEDYGIWLQATLKNGQEINVNAFGGIRKVSTRDWASNPNAEAKGTSSTARTDAIASRPTQININITTGGMLQHDTWLNVDPTGGSKIALRTLRSYSIGGVENPINEGHILDDRYSVIKTRETIGLMKSSRDKKNSRI